MAAATFSLAFNSALTEDYIHTADILASAGATQPLATFLNSQNQSEALVVHDDGELCHLQREPLSSSGWNIMGIGASVATIAAADSGSVWLTDFDQNIWMSNAGHWNLIQNLPGGDQQLSVGTDGTIYGTALEGSGNTVQYIYDPVSASFQLNQDVAYASPPVGSPGNLWAIDYTGAIVTNSGGMWMECQGQPNATPQTLYACPDQSVWALCQGGYVYVLDSDGFDWDLMNIPDGVFAFAPANENLFYVLAGSPSTPTLYSCDGNGNNTVVAQPVGRPLNGISVGLDGTLWGLDSIGTVWRNSNSSWIRMIQPTDLSGTTGGLQVTEVVTGRHALGDQYAFYVINGGLSWSVFQEQSGVFGGYWTQKASVFSGISNIGVVNDPVTASNLIVYGVSSNGNFVVIQNVGGNWTASEHSMKTSLSGIAPRFATYNSAWFTYAVIDQQLQLGVGGLNSPPTTLKPVPGAPPLSSLIPFSTIPNGADTVLLAGIDPQGQVWTITTDLKNFAFSQLSGSSIGSPIGAVQRAVGMIAGETAGARIYAVDVANSALWVIRQTTYGPEPPLPVPGFGWTEWHPLGNVCAVLGTGCTMPATNAPDVPPVDLFSLDLGSEVNVLSEDPVTGALTDLVMLKPAGTNTDAEYVARYVSELTITDNNGSPQSNFQVSVAADEAIGVWVGETLYNVTPANPAQLTTNQLGQITFAFFAGDLHTPTFSFSAPNLISPPTVYPAQNVNGYLAGSATALPNQPVFDSGGATLTGANMQTAPTWEANASISFIQGSTSTANAPAAANAIIQTYTIPVSANGTSGQWTVAASSGDLLGGSSFWHDLCNFPHDIDHAIKKAAMKVTSIEVDLKNKLVTLGMELASGVSQLLTLVINTAKDVISAVKSAFRFVERGVLDAIDWLKSLFDWGDVLNTKLVLETALNGLMTKLGENFNPNSPAYAGTIFKTYFNDLVSAIQQGFNKAESVFSPTQTFSDTTNSSPYPPAAAPMGGDSLHPTNMSNAQSGNGTQTNYVHTHAMHYSSQGGTYPPTTMGDGTSGDGVLQALFLSIEQNLNQDPYKTAQMETITNLQSIFSDPKNFADVVIFDIINAIDKAVMFLLDVIESVVETMISLAGNALQGFQTLFNKPIHIPIISWIYEKISDHPLTMLDLFCLALALPATLLYKLTFGMPHLKPPFDDAAAQQIIQQFSDPDTFPWPSIASNQSLAATPQLQGSFPFPGAEFLLPAVAVFYALIDGCCDATAYGNRQIVVNPNYANPVDSFLSWMSIINSMAMQWLCASYSIFNGQPSVADRMTLANWGLNFASVTSSLVFTIGSSQKAIAEFNATSGLPLTCGIGLFLRLVGGICG